MQDKTNHILLCLAEEAGEIVQAVSKVLRFGIDNYNPEHQRGNKLALEDEIQDLFGVVEMLTDMGVIDGVPNREKIEAKKAKIIEHLPNSIKEID